MSKTIMLALVCAGCLAAAPIVIPPGTPALTLETGSTLDVHFDIYGFAKANPDNPYPAEFEFEVWGAAPTGNTTQLAGTSLSYYEGYNFTLSTFSADGTRQTALTLPFWANGLHLFAGSTTIATGDTAAIWANANLPQGFFDGVSLNDPNADAGYVRLTNLGLPITIAGLPTRNIGNSAMIGGLAGPGPVTTGSSGGFIYYDSSPVTHMPEPATWGVTAIALGALAHRRTIRE